MTEKRDWKQTCSSTCDQRRKEKAVTTLPDSMLTTCFRKKSWKVWCDGNHSFWAHLFQSPGHHKKYPFHHSLLPISPLEIVAILKEQAVQRVKWLSFLWWHIILKASFVLQHLGIAVGVAEHGSAGGVSHDTYLPSKNEQAWVAQIPDFSSLLPRRISRGQGNCRGHDH